MNDLLLGGVKGGGSRTRGLSDPLRDRNPTIAISVGEAEPSLIIHAQYHSLSLMDSHERSIVGTKSDR
jgi:hypothetical protein